MGLIQDGIRREAEFKDQLGIFEVLSRLGVNQQGVPTMMDPNNKDKSIQPLMDSKAADLVRSGIQRKSDHNAGAMEAYNRIAMHQLGRAQQASALAGGTPFVTHEGRRYLQNPKTGALKPDTAVPRDEMGRTAVQQEQGDMRIIRANQQIQASNQKGFDTALKGLGFTSRADLFDSKLHQGGTVDGNTGEFIQTPEAEQTHVRVGFQSPKTDEKGKLVLDRNKKPIGGRAGVLISTDDLVAYQNQAAALAGPEALNVLDWLRKNPNDKRLPAAKKKFQDLIAKSSSQGVAMPSQADINIEQSATDGEE